MEIKDKDPACVPYYKKVIEECGLSKDQIQIIAFDKGIITKCKELMPDIKALWLFSFKKDKKSGKMAPSLEDLKKTLKQMNADGAGAKNNPILTKEFVSDLQKANYTLNVWTVNDTKSSLILKNSGVDFITTDRPAMIRNAVNGK